MIRRPTWILTALLLIAWSGLFAPALAVASGMTVALVIDEKSRLHERFLSGLMPIINKSGHGDFQLRAIDINDPADTKSLNAPDIAYAIAVGVKPARFTLSHNPPYPVLYTLIPEGTYEEIIGEYPIQGSHEAARRYVIYLSQKPSRLLHLGQLLTPEKARIGMVVGDYSNHQRQGIEQAASSAGLDLVTQYAATKDAAIRKIEKTLETTDIYLALYDTTILNRQNAKWLLYMAYKMRKPVIGFSNSYTRAGAVASIFSTPEQIGQQSGDWLLSMVQGKAVPEHQHPNYFTVSINTNIQRMLRLERHSGEEIKRIIEDRERGNADNQGQ